MLKALSIILFMLCSVVTQAQDRYFIYMQTPAAQPFFVRLDERIIPSNPGGWLSISDLPQGNLILIMGFPSQRGTFRFDIPVGSKDLGYLVQPGPDPRLEDLQSGSVLNYQQFGGNPADYSYAQRTDDFSKRLARAVNDTSLLTIITAVNRPPAGASESLAVVTKPTTPLEDPVAVTPAKSAEVDTIVVRPVDTIAVQPETIAIKVDTVAMVEVVDSAVAATPATDPVIDTSVAVMPAQETVMDTALAVSPVEDTVTKKPEESLVNAQPATTGSEPETISRPKRYSETSTSEGFGLVYIDGGDTIRLVIPNPRFTLVESEPQVKEDTGMITRQRVPATEPALAANCPGLATESELAKLRKAMQRGSTDETMVAEAKKLFKTKCLTTAQVRELALMFKTSAGKYLFYDAAYLHVTDREQFPALASDITDDYYARRFRALVGE